MDFHRAALISSAALALAAATACGDDGGASGAGGAGGGASQGSGPGAGTGLASVDPGSPNDPEHGCLDGFTACGVVCADLTNDYRYCGDCETDCAFLSADVQQVCVDGACVPAPCEETDCACQSATCDGECRYGMSASADDCGGCNNRCADDHLCVDSTCRSAEGQGTSCEDPLIWNLEENDDAGFRWSEGLADEHVFVCGPLDPVPTRWFRVTVPKSDLRLELTGDPGDDYIVEIFSDVACDEAASLACADGEPGNEIDIEEITVTAGSTFWIAVGLKNEWSGAGATIRIDT